MDETPITSAERGGEYQWYNIKDYDNCYNCIHFSDNSYMERFECRRGTNSCNKRTFYH
mgnify:CR=1 FL=1